MANHKDLPLVLDWNGPAVYEPLPEVPKKSKTHTSLAKKTKFLKICAIKRPFEHRGIPIRANHRDLPMIWGWTGLGVYEPLRRPK